MFFDLFYKDFPCSYVTSSYLKLRIDLHMFMKKRIYALIVTYAHLISITMKSNIKVTSNNKTLLALFNTIAHFYYDVIRHVSIEQLWNCTPLIPLKSIIVMSVFFHRCISSKPIKFIIDCTAFIYFLINLIKHYYNIYWNTSYKQLKNIVYM